MSVFLKILSFSWVSLARSWNSRRKLSFSLLTINWVPWKLTARFMLYLQKLSTVFHNFWTCMKLRHSSSKCTWSCYNVFARDPYSGPGACTWRFVSQICDTKDFQVENTAEIVDNVIHIPVVWFISISPTRRSRRPNLKVFHKKTKNFCS